MLGVGWLLQLFIESDDRWLLAVTLRQPQPRVRFYNYQSAAAVTSEHEFCVILQNPSLCRRGKKTYYNLLGQQKSGEVSWLI